MTMKFRSTSGNPLRALSAFIERANKGAEVGLQSAATILVTSIKGVLSTPGQGAEYPRGKKKKHRASKPGDPPARDTSALHNSIDIEKVGPRTVRVGTGLEYAPILEHGTASLAPRPFMLPGKQAAEKQMGEAIVADLKSATKK